MAETKGTSGVKSAPEPEPGPETHVCTVGFCPICFAVSALQPLKPEAVEHLLNASREFLLAVKAVLESRAEDLAEQEDASRKLERIDIA